MLPRHQVLRRGNVGRMDNKVEASILDREGLYRCYIGIMEKKMESTVCEALSIVMRGFLK